MIDIFGISLYFQKKVLKKYFDKLKIKNWIKESKILFKSIVLKIPYIGGKENKMFSFLQFSLILMPIVIILKKEGIATREIGNTIYDIAALVFNQIPLPFRWIIASGFFSEKKIRNYKKISERSHLRKFPEDFVTDFVEGNSTSKFGYEIKECALLKFWRSQGLEEFVPYLCLTDWIKWKTLGVEVNRTKTLANGSEKCDFQYIGKGRNSPPGWPPESVKEWTGIFEK